MLEAEFREAVRGLPLAKSAYFSSLGSTNDVAAKWGKEGTKGLCLAYADEQTMGRGRAGRTWFTPPGSALAFSILLDTDQALEPNLLGLFSGLGALAVCEGLEKLYQLSPQIKWPNDVLLDGKKVCGVLAEALWAGERLQALILGIGINIAPDSVPSQTYINFPATSIEGALRKKVVPGRLLRNVLENLITWKEKMGQPQLVQAWEQRLAYAGERVRLETVEQTGVEGIIQGLNTDGSLRLHLPNGETKSFHVGEIQLRPLVDTASK